MLRRGRISSCKPLLADEQSASACIALVEECAKEIDPELIASVWAAGAQGFARRRIDGLKDLEITAFVEAGAGDDRDDAGVVSERLREQMGQVVGDDERRGQEVRADEQDGEGSLIEGFGEFHLPETAGRQTGLIPEVKGVGILTGGEMELEALSRKRIS